MYFGNTLWHTAEACICASILCFYLTIFEHQFGFRLQVNILFVYTAVWGIAAGLGEILLCVPPSNFWNMKDLNKCGKFMNYILATAVTDYSLGPDFRVTYQANTSFKHGFEEKTQYPISFSTRRFVSFLQTARTKSSSYCQLISCLISVIVSAIIRIAFIYDRNETARE